MIIGISGKKGSGKDTVGNMINYFITRKYWKAVDWDFYSFPNDEEKVKKLLLNGFPIKMRYDVGQFKVVKFADALKDITCILLGCTREQLEDRDFKENPLPEEWWCYPVSKKDEFGEYNDVLLDYKTHNVDESYLRKTTPRLVLQLLGTEGVRNVIHPNAWVNATMNNYKCGCEQDKRRYNWDTINCMQCTGKPNWLITDMRFPNELSAVHNQKGISLRIDRPSIVSTDTHPSETALDDALFKHRIVNDGSLEDLKYKVQEFLVLHEII